MMNWRGESFYPFGLGATSLVVGFRYARPTRLPLYKVCVEYRKYAVDKLPAGDSGAHPSYPRAAVLDVVFAGAS